MRILREIEVLTPSAFQTLYDGLIAEGNLSAAEDVLWCRCATDLELFALEYFPHYCVYDFNDLHGDIFDDFKYGQRSVRRARAAPRGYAKSTIEALIKPIHDVCYALEDFIVIFSNTQGQSDQKLADIRSEIFQNDKLVAAYGICFRTKKPGATRFIVYCGKHRCLFQSYGAGAEVRGIRFGSKRPTKIICDDLEHSEEVLNEALRAKMENNFRQVISKIGNENTSIEVVGTILHPQSLLAGLMKNPAYEAKIYKAVISWSKRQDLWNEWQRIYSDFSDGERKASAQAFYDANEKAMLDGVVVLWPQKEPYLFLMKEMIETGRRAFMKEKQNEPMGADEVLFEKIHWYHEEKDGFRIESNNQLIPWDLLKDRQGQWLDFFGCLDPASGQTKSRAGRLGDFSSILSGPRLALPGREFKYRLFVHHDWSQRGGSSKWMPKIFDQHEEFGYQKFGVETNLYRDLLIPNLEAERKSQQVARKKEIKIPFYDIENRENKEKRIHTLEPKVTHGWILFNRALSETTMQMIEPYPHVDHDDAPDCLEMLWGLVNNRYKAGGVGLNQGGR